MVILHTNLRIESQDEVGRFAEHYNDLIHQMKKSLAGIQNLSYRDKQDNVRTEYCSQ
jgi:hypothetical protein